MSGICSDELVRDLDFALDQSESVPVIVKSGSLREFTPPLPIRPASLEGSAHKHAVGLDLYDFAREIARTLEVLDAAELGTNGELLQIGQFHLSFLLRNTSPYALYTVRFPPYSRRISIGNRRKWDGVGV
jgi:hypothetical protein